jgi:hypothetical protein
MVKIAVNLFRSNIGCHSNDGDSRVSTANIQSGGDAIEPGHDDVHENHVKVIPSDVGDPGNSIRAVRLVGGQLSHTCGTTCSTREGSLTACSTSQPMDLRNLIPIFAQVGSSSTRNTFGFLGPHMESGLLI